jgi:hypothetical protein
MVGDAAPSARAAGVAGLVFIIGVLARQRRGPGKPSARCAASKSQNSNGLATARRPALWHHGGRGRYQTAQRRAGMLPPEPVGDGKLFEPVARIMSDTTSRLAGRAEQRGRRSAALFGHALLERHGRVHSGCSCLSCDQACDNDRVKQPILSAPCGRLSDSPLADSNARREANPDYSRGSNRRPWPIPQPDQVVHKRSRTDTVPRECQNGSDSCAPLDEEKTGFLQSYLSSICTTSLYGCIPNRVAKGVLDARDFACPRKCAR